MADENMIIKAKKIYDDLCRMLDSKDWKYDKDEEKLRIYFNAMGEDLPMNFILVVDANRQLIRLLSPMPYKIPENKRLDLAIATCAATYSMADGSFDYDIEDGSIFFRLTASFRESTIGDGLFEYMIYCSGAMVDKYNDKFFAIGKGILELTDFLKEEY